MRTALTDGAIREVVEVANFGSLLSGTTALSVESESNLDNSVGECVRFTGTPLLDVLACEDKRRSFALVVLRRADEDVGAVSVVDLGALA